MKKILIILFMILSSLCFAIEVKETLECEGNNCTKKVKFTNLKEKPMLKEEYVAGSCLVELKDDSPTFYMVNENDRSKVTLLKELSFEKNVAIWQRVDVWNNELNKNKFKKIPCNQTETFFDLTQVQKCLKQKRVFYKVFCDIKYN